MSVLIAGCGWLGTAVGRRIVDAGDRVIGVRRSPEATAGLIAAGIEPWIGDLGDEAFVRSLPDDLRQIVSCPSAGARSVERYREAYIEINRSLLALARERPVRGFVYTGSTGVFGETDGRRLDESSPVSPADDVARVLVEAEELVLGAHRPEMSARVVRLSGLYGPGRTGVIDRVREGSLALGPGDDAWMNWCHRDDAAATVVAVLRRAGRPGPFHASDAHPVRRRDAVAWIAARLGIDPPRHDRARGRGTSRRVSADATRAELGLDLAFPSYRDGLAPHLPPLSRA